MKGRVFQKGLAGALTISAVVLFTAARSEGYAGGYTSGTGCSGCHTGGANGPTRSDTIPATLTPGTTNTYTFGASALGAGHTRAGFYLSVDQGVTLSDGGSGYTAYCSTAPTAATTWSSPPPAPSWW